MTSTATNPKKFHLSPETTRKWNAFKRNRLGYYSAIILFIMAIASVSARLWSNDKPLIIRYQGAWYFPSLISYPDTTFGGIFETPADYHDPDTLKAISTDSNWAIWPINRWDYKTINGNPALQHPSPPSRENFLGTDDRGRDLLARLVYGIRVSLGFGIAGVLIYTTIGVFIGAIQGFFGGWVDMLLQRIIEIWDSLPYLYMLIIIASLIEPGLSVILLLMALFSWTRVQEYVRVDFFKSRNLDYVKAAQALGVSNTGIMFKHILPNAMTNIVIRLPFAVVGTIETLVTLDYLGFGVQPPTPSLGELFKQAQSHLDAWWLLIFTGGSLLGLTILITNIGFTVLDILDPRRNG
jgi:microcin C transport system permease protein